MKDLADLPVTARPRTAAFGLNADHRVAEADPGNENPSLVEHGGRNAVAFLTGRLPPGFDHAFAGRFGQFLKPRQIALLFQLH